MAMQQTLAQPIEFSGIGLHSGAPVHMKIKPGCADSGIVFRRLDVTDCDPFVPALWDRVVASRLCTLIANDGGVSVSTVEHVMAALAGCAIHNALIEIDGPEAPILDGSAAPFVAGILRAGIAALPAPLRAILVKKPIELRQEAAMVRLEPADMLEINFEIDFADAAIGRQSLALNMANGTFVRELSGSRTFCSNADVIAMRARGLALGGTMENAVVFDGAKVLSPGGLRQPDEPVRHKMLDALGDLALAGAPILGRYTGYRAGHAMTNGLLRALFSDPSAWEYAEVGRALYGKLPGVGLRHSDLPYASAAH